MEEFYGQGLPREQLDLLGLRINAVHREGEATLARSCWFDYRLMHPTERTYLYAHLYQRQLRAFMAKTRDERDASAVRAFITPDVFASRDLTSVWNARRFADEFSLPYPFVLAFCQSRFFDRAQLTFPRPNQLYGEELEADLLPAWKTQLMRQITHATHPYFRASAWRGEPLQVEHLQFVVGQVKTRPAPRHRLIARLLNEDVLSASLAGAHFEPSELDAAERYRENLG